MRIAYGVWLLWTAGCAIPNGRTLRPEPSRAGLPFPPAHSLGVHVGVEYLPADDFSGPGDAPEPRPTPAFFAPEVLEPAVLARRAPCTATPVVPTRDLSAEPRPTRDDRFRWALSEQRLARVHSSLERFTLHFLRDLMGRDRRRIQRELGASLLLARQPLTTYQGPPNPVDLRDQEDQELLVGRHSGRLLRGPFRRALRTTPLVRAFELTLDEFKAEHVPLSEPYQTARGGSWKLGSLKMRLHTSRPDDFFELVYSHSGWRIEAGMRKLEIGHTTELAEDLWLSLRSQLDYERSEWVDLYASLRWDVTPDTRVRVLAGDHLDLLTGTRFYPIVQTPLVLRAIDASPGIMAYVEHLF